jgi:chemotaxis protein methyltransferase CheR
VNWTHADFAVVADLVSQRTGLSFANRRSGAELGICRAMDRAHLKDLVQYATLLADHQDAFDDLINELTVGETYFFRESSHFRFIQRVVLPEIRQRRGSDHHVRAWSASCASGEEAYSLAIVFEQQNISPQALVAATDISRSALAKARQARFGAWSLRGDGRPWVMPYLTAVGNIYQLDEKVRQRVAFSHLNLALDAYPSFAAGIWGLDMILCRNVLIYFDRHTISQVARRLFNTLADGGWLLTASSDPPLWEDAPFEVVTTDEGIFYRRPVTPVTPAKVVIVEPETFSFPWEGEAPVEPLTFADATPVAAAMPDPLDEACEALARGDCRRVVRLTADLLDDASAATLHVRALANLDATAAEVVCARVASQHSFCAELHYLHAVLLIDARRHDEAVQAMRRVLYLDRTLAAAHYTLGSILRQRGDSAGAQRAYRNVRDLCAQRPPEEPVALADGETAGRMAQLAAAELLLLEGMGAA